MPCRRGSCTHCLLFYFREVSQECSVCPAVLRGNCTHCLLVYFREVLQECSVCPAGEETVLIVFLFISEKFHRSVVYTL